MEFQSFLDKRNKLEDKFNSKLISLNLKNRLAEAKNEKELDDIFDDDYNEKNPQTNSLVKIKGLTESDLMLNETLLILKDWLEINDSKTIINF